MPSLILVMIFEFALTCLWGLWCHGLGISVKIGFRQLSFTVRSQFHHSIHTNQRTFCGRTRQRLHKASILAESENEKRAGNEHGKRGVRGHKEHKGDENENDKNGSREKNGQEEHNRKVRTAELLRLLIARSEVVPQQKFIEQQALLYSLFVQVLWYRALVQAITRTSTASTHSPNYTFPFMNVFQSRTSSDSDIGIPLRTPSIESTPSSAEVSTQTESATMATQQTVRYIIPFPAPGVPGAPYFNGSDVTRFLDRFKLLGDNHGVEDENLVRKLPEYCEPGIQEEVKAQSGYTVNNWDQLYRQLRKRYYRYDTYQQMYSKSFLEAYKDQDRSMDDDIETYCATFKSISASLEIQNMLDNHTRCCWFLAGLPKKMRSKLMEKHDVDPQDPSTMKFERLYDDAQKRASKLERERGLGKAMGEETLQELNRQKKTPMKNDPINVRADGTLPLALKPVERKEPKEKSKDKADMKTVGQSQIDELTSKFESLALNLNALTEEIKQRGRTGEMPRPANQAGPGYAPNPRAPCYGCGMSGHNMRNCPDIEELINKGIVHRDSTGKLCWGKEGSDGMWVRLMHGLLWKDDILKQAKDKEIMAQARANVSFVQAADAAIEANETVRSQNVELCGIGHENDPDDTDEEYIDPDSSNLLDVLAALMETRNKSKPNPKAKNAKVVQGRVEKEKRYAVPRILRRGEYIDAPRQANPADQSNSTRDQVIEETPAPSQTVTGDEIEQSDDIAMVDKPARRAPAPRGKKLAKELKDRAKESSEKLLALLMGQEVRGITVQDILGSSLSVHKMMFQNLPPELRSDVDDDGVVQVSSTAIESKDELNDLWAVGTLKYRANIGKGNVTCLLDSGAEINVMLYHIALKLGLAVRSNVTVAMKGAGDLKSPFIGYIPDVPVRIGDVVVKQPFFILEKGSNSCILGRPFETITRMARQTLNDGSVRVTVFDPENDMVQATFQPYTPGDPGDRYGYQVIEVNSAQAIKKDLNSKRGT